MALFEEANIDVSAEFKAPVGTVFLTTIIKAEGLPTAALIVDHKTKDMYIYEYKEGEISVSLSPIEDDEVRKELQDIVATAMKRERGH
jgi:hypothetical protein